MYYKCTYKINIRNKKNLENNFHKLKTKFRNKNLQITFVIL